MNLFSAYALTGGVFCAAGAALFFAGTRLAPALTAFPRSRAAGNLLWAAALAWFAYHLATIGEVDLAGFPRWSFFVLFGGAGVLAFRFLADLLPLRALAVLTLFACNELLKIGFGQTPRSCVLAGTAYLLIVGALWVGAAPYVLRDALAFSTRTPGRSRAVGGALLLLGAANLASLLFLQ